MWSVLVINGIGAEKIRKISWYLDKVKTCNQHKLKIKNEQSTNVGISVKPVCLKILKTKAEIIMTNKTQKVKYEKWHITV